MNRFVTMVAVVGVVAAVTSVNAQEDQLKRLRGAWEVIELVEDGKVIPKQAIPEWLPSGGRLEIEENAIVIHSPVDQKKHVRIFAIDATQYPHTITITDAKKDETRGIFRFDENRLIVCLAEAGEKLPTEFSAKEGSHRILMVLQPAKGIPSPAAAPATPPAKPKTEDLPAATVVTDQDITRMLAGAWRLEDSVGSLYVLFRSNGTFSTTREVQELRLFQRVFVQTPVTAGTWKVERGTIRFTATSSLHPERVGNTFGFAVRSISETDMIYIDYLGHVGRARRVNLASSAR